MAAHSNGLEHKHLVAHAINRAVDALDYSYVGALDRLRSNRKTPACVEFRQRYLVSRFQQESDVACSHYRHLRQGRRINPLDVP